MSGTADRENLRPASPAESQRLRTGFLRLKGALFDKVTDLYAYSVHANRLQALAEGRPLAVVLVEFPELADLESACGWETSDRFLAGVAALLRALKGRDLPRTSILALESVHGSGFLVFVPEGCDGSDLTPAELAGCAASLTRHLEARMRAAEWAATRAPLEFAVGHAFVSPNPAARFERRLHQGIRDARLMTLRHVDRLMEERSAGLAAILRDVSLTTHYQPIVDMTQGLIMGYEALTRGPANTVYEVPEALFSSTKVARVRVELDALCRREAVRNARGFDPGKKLFLNSLPETLGTPGFADEDLCSMLQEVALLPRNLVLEITERTSIQDFEVFGRELDRLRRQGFLVAIDDVGTGYSSLQTITELQPDFLKVDMSLVKNIHRSLIKQELVHSLLKVGARIGAQVIAEGIEIEEEYRALRLCGVRYGQGFFFARPAPPFPPLDRGGRGSI